MADTLVRPAKRRPNWWVQHVREVWLDATLAWEKKAEAETSLYDTELREFAQQHPRPRFKDFLVGLSQPQPEEAA